MLPLYVGGVQFGPSAARLPHAVVALGLATLIAGCGTAYSKQDFVTRADAICNNAVRDTRSIAPAGAATRRDAALAGYAARLLPILESERNQLHGLKLPPQTATERATLTGYFKALSEQIDATRRLMLAARDRDADAIVNAEAALSANRAAPLATRYGLRSCGNPGGTAV
jgi:hypothetical protein